MSSHYHRLLQLGRLLYELQQQDAVRHDFGDLLRARLGRKYAEVAELLLRQLTLLRRTSRHIERGAYVSESEDLAATFQLILGELKEVRLLSMAGELAFHRLKVGLKPGQWFRREDVQRLTGYSKTQSWRYLGYWQTQGRVKQVGGSSAHGYYYQLCS